MERYLGEKVVYIYFISDSVEQPGPGLERKYSNSMQICRVAAAELRSG